MLQTDAGVRKKGGGGAKNASTFAGRLDDGRRSLGETWGRGVFEEEARRRLATCQDFPGIKGPPEEPPLLTLDSSRL